ncbi:DUF397 domain-containing protein [Streptomyces sp. ID05-47C]|jgi:hypothetical protein|uniref:DUF397 domain-containing protein n=1 Tax=Streptomyces sp. ID05-47C TaxID=3028665 RepID=UPI0029A1C6A6|nr:DUF397 domain-containing protein [Streptomyces sp. ID05-47C]MDX3574853.1 DUF397 domain-containing protein [Streptomyces sp. ID05-47C]
MPELTWQKSTYSAEAANCVYVATSPSGTIHLRESDQPDVILTTTAPSLHALICDIKNDLRQLQGRHGPL